MPPLTWTRILAFLVFVISLVAVFTTKIDPLTGILIGVLAVALLLP